MLLSTFDCTGNHAFDDLFAEYEVKDDNGGHGDEHGCHLFRIIRCELAFELGQSQRNGLQAYILDQNQCEGELIPAAEYLNDCYGHEDRFADRENDVPQRIAEAASVDGCCLFQRNRNGLHIAFYQENSHRESERHIGEQQSEPLVGKTAFFKYNIDRNQKGMDRNQHTHQEHYIDQTIQFKVDTGKNVAHNKAERNDQNDGKYRCTDTVPHGSTQMIIGVA